MYSSSPHSIIVASCTYRQKAEKQAGGAAAGCRLKFCSTRTLALLRELREQVPCSLTHHHPRLIIHTQSTCISGEHGLRMIELFLSVREVCETNK